MLDTRCSSSNILSFTQPPRQTLRCLHRRHLSPRFNLSLAKVCFLSPAASFSIGDLKILPNRHFGSTKKSQQKTSPVCSITTYWLHRLPNVQIVCSLVMQ